MEKTKRHHALKHIISQYYANEMLISLLATGFTEDEICAELRNTMKRISKEEVEIKGE